MCRARSSTARSKNYNSKKKYRGESWHRKYDPLLRYLRDSGQHEVKLRFDDIATMVDSGLPPSAYDPGRRMWWSNTADSARPGGRMARGRLRRGPQRRGLRAAPGEIRPAVGVGPVMNAARPAANDAAAADRLAGTLIGLAARDALGPGDEFATPPPQNEAAI